MASGGLGAAVSNPADKIMVEFQVDGTRPTKRRNNYKNFYDAAVKMVKKDGPSCLMKGVIPNVIRSGVLTMG